MGFLGVPKIDFTLKPCDKRRAETGKGGGAVFRNLLKMRVLFVGLFRSVVVP